MITKSEMLLHAARLEEAARDMRRMASVIDDGVSSGAPGRLSEDDVRKIRAQAAAGISATTLAKRHGVSRGLIWAVAKGIAYRNVTP